MIEQGEKLQIRQQMEEILVKARATRLELEGQSGLTRQDRARLILALSSERLAKRMLILLPAQSASEMEER